MKTLLVLPQPPAAEGGAADRCSLGLIRGLESHGVDVQVIAAHFSFTPSYDLPTVDRLDIVQVETAGSWRQRLDNLVRPHGDLGRGGFAERVREAAAAADVLHLEQIETAAGLTPLGSQPSVAHLHYRAAFDQAPGPPWRRHYRQVMAFVRAERRAANAHRWLLANSPRVADSLREVAPHAEIVVAPLTLDGARYTPASTRPDAPTAGLIGNGRWAPTAAALDRLVGRVWPDVVARVPAAQLLIAGRATEVRATEDGVVRVGEVPSATAFLRGLDVLVFPVVRGSGMKVKVLEASALGVPVVTTPEGAEGLPPSDGVIVATDDRDLAEATSRILLDPAERRQRAEAARATFDRFLAPGPATEPIVELYRRMSSS
ncbi:MAG: polysaccharide biosynthesis protein PslH [Actinomycetota bacterium]|jgi:glycosyltransferase involved in cell wall biosynthesis|nr:polysaccharide biosynthesis protein PslH [Actinomycetota bacterium]